MSTTSRKPHPSSIPVTAAQKAYVALSCEELYLLRLEAGLTQAEIAERIGVATHTVGHWENGRSMPRHDRAAAYLALIGVEL